MEQWSNGIGPEVCPTLGPEQLRSGLVGPAQFKQTFFMPQAGGW